MNDSQRIHALQLALMFVTGFLHRTDEKYVPAAKKYLQEVTTALENNPDHSDADRKELEELFAEIGRLLQAGQ